MNHVRDTEFGQFVRFLSSGRLFRYPDEVDSLLWECLLQQSSPHTVEDLGVENLAASRKPESISEAFPTQGEREKDQTKKEHGDTILVGWYGSEDLENPQNWPSSRKLLVTAQICILNFAVYIGSAIYVPGGASLMEDFGVSHTQVILGMSLFVLGYGLGPMLFSPMSEMPTIGRSSIYFWTLFAFVVLQLPVGFAINMPMLLVFRFLTGFFGGPPLSTGGATIADMYPPEKIMYGICIWGAFGILGPVLGPIAGGFVAQAKGWRWTIWVLTWLCSAVLVMLFFLMPETSADNILYRRAKRLRKLTGNRKLKSQSEIAAEGITTRHNLIVLGRAFTLTFTEPIVFALDLYTALLYGVLYIWFESFPLVFGGIYGFNIGQQGLVFLGLCVGGIITVPCYLFWIQRYMVPRFAESSVKPETIIPPSFVGAFALPICLFWYGWTSRSEIHWIVPIVGSGIFTISIVLLFNPVLNYLGMAYPQCAASVYAGNALFRALFGVVFPLFARSLFQNLGIGPGNSLLGGLAILFIPIPFALYYYGNSLRHWSKNAQHDT